LPIAIRRAVLSDTPSIDEVNYSARSVLVKLVLYCLTSCGILSPSSGCQMVLVILETLRFGRDDFHVSVRGQLWDNTLNKAEEGCRSDHNECALSRQGQQEV